MSEGSSVEQLQERLAVDWPEIRAARERASEKRSELRALLEGLDSEDTSVVVSGSLARDEFTVGSDIDWTLLIDGSADPVHYDVSTRIAEAMKNVAQKETGAEGTFSTMVFSHDLIHQIGGEDDTNRNTTRRLLLLLESKAIGREEAYQRVVRNILNRYLLEDHGFWKGSSYRVPRFLQNDFARFWRTMAVDFAYKLRKRSGKGWAIRNTKLRMSRKLIYVSGLLACYGCHFDYSEKDWKEIASSQDRQAQVVGYLDRVFRQTPLEMIAGTFMRFPHLDGAARDILKSYNDFLGILSDDTSREGLEALSEEDATDDPIYQSARELSHRFRNGLLVLFFDDKSGMAELTRNYGVF